MRVMHHVRIKVVVSFMGHCAMPRTKSVIWQNMKNSAIYKTVYGIVTKNKQGNPMVETKITINDTTIRLIIGDLTDLETEAVVFYAEPNLDLGSGFGNAISMRGGPSIKKELSQHEPISMGEAIVSTAGELKASYIIHANGPKFQEEDTEVKLHDTILNSLKCAKEKNIKQIAFPPMGTGFYGIPLSISAKVMTNVFHEYLNQNSEIDEILIATADNREYKPFETALNS
jgi:O-acetyl-ADP-ribose deacetylase